MVSLFRAPECRSRGRLTVVTIAVYPSGRVRRPGPPVPSRTSLADTALYQAGLATGVRSPNSTSAVDAAMPPSARRYRGQ